MITLRFEGPAVRDAVPDEPEPRVEIPGSDSGVTLDRAAHRLERRERETTQHDIGHPVRLSLHHRQERSMREGDADEEEPGLRQGRHSSVEGCVLVGRTLGLGREEVEHRPVSGAVEQCVSHQVRAVREAEAIAAELGDWSARCDPALPQKRQQHVRNRYRLVAQPTVGGP